MAANTYENANFLADMLTLWLWYIEFLTQNKHAAPLN